MWLVHFIAAGLIAGRVGAPVPPVNPPEFGWSGGGINADREWFEREAAEQRAAAKAEARKRREQAERQAEQAEIEAARPRDAFIRISAPTFAPLAPRRQDSRAVFEAFAAQLQAIMADRERLAAEEAERQAIAFALEQQRLAEEAAARQFALDEEAAMALFALLMNE